MATPITVVESGGVPISPALSGMPFTPTSNAFPATVVATGGLPVTFVDATGALVPVAYLPTGYLFLIDSSGNYLVDSNGAYLIGAA
jgi:hypothetical protein